MNETDTAPEFTINQTLLARSQSLGQSEFPCHHKASERIMHRRFDEASRNQRPPLRPVAS